MSRDRNRKLRDTENGVRLSAAELALLGCFLFGRRWQMALARAIGVHPSLAARWKSGARPVSIRCTSLILNLVAERQACRSAALAERYHAMIRGLDVPARDWLARAAAS